MSEHSDGPDCRFLAEGTSAGLGLLFLRNKAALLMSNCQMLLFNAPPALPKTQWPGRAGSGSPAVDRHHMFTLAGQLNAEPHKFPMWHVGIFQHCSCSITQQGLYYTTRQSTLQRKSVFFYTICLKYVDRSLLF